jgi:hypothetical protein
MLLTKPTNSPFQHNWKIIYLPSGDPADYAGNLAATLENLWLNQTKYTVSSQVARLRQRLYNNQIHRR